MLIVPVAAISPDTGPKLRMMISSSDKDIRIPYVEIPVQKFKAFAAGCPMMFQSYLELSIKMLIETLVKTDDSMSNGSFRGLGSLYL